MSPNCIDVDRIADLASLSEDHPARRHARECPRCRSLWVSYQSFMEATAVPGADLEAARRDLDAAIRRGGAEAFPSAAPPASRIGWRELFAGLLRPVPAVAIAAVVLVAAVVVWRAQTPETTVLRGGEGGRGFDVHRADVTATAMTFSWGEVRDADGYEVRLFDAALNEIHRAAVPGTTVTVLRSDLPPLPEGASLTWRVYALRGGDVIRTSAPRSVHLPG